MSNKKEWVEISNDGKFQGYLCLPPSGRGPGIVLLQEIFGVNEHIRGLADNFAQAGYVVLAPDVFWRSQRRVSFGYDRAEREQAMALMKETDLSIATSDIGTAVSKLRWLDGVVGKVTAIGYCYGGLLAYMAAASGSVDAAVAYYGGGIQNRLEHADSIEVPILFHFGALDAHIPMSAVKSIEQAFAGRDNATVYIYPDADHGFNAGVRASYHEASAKLALRRTFAFLKTL